MTGLNPCSNCKIYNMAALIQNRMCWAKFDPDISLFCVCVCVCVYTPTLTPHHIETTLSGIVLNYWLLQMCLSCTRLLIHIVCLRV